MPVKVLHHGRCFDGAASAALFAAFYRAKHDPNAEFAFVPKHHRSGDPFDDVDFAAETVAIVDFRYSQREGLSWYFDHHRSAFQLPGDRDHFDAQRDNGRYFHDEAAPSCTSMMGDILLRDFSFDSARWTELIRWAERIDAARFATPTEPVDFEIPAMRLAAFIQSVNDLDDIDRYIRELLEARTLADLAAADYVEAVVAPRLEAHRRDTALVAEATRIEDGVLEYDLLDHGPRILSHFIPWAQHPDVRYVVGTYAHDDGDLRLTVGFNPWTDSAEREHDLAALCESAGGGGHPHVAGASFELNEADRLRAAAARILSVLRGRADGA